MKKKKNNILWVSSSGSGSNRNKALGELGIYKNTTLEYLGSRNEGFIGVATILNDNELMIAGERIPYTVIDTVSCLDNNVITFTITRIIKNSKVILYFYGIAAKRKAIVFCNAEDWKIGDKNE